MKSGEKRVIGQRITTARTGHKDSYWYREHEKLLRKFSVIDFLAGDGKYRQEQKRRFLQGEIQNPTLDYPELNVRKLKNIQKKLRTFQETVALFEPVLIKGKTADRSEARAITNLYKSRIDFALLELDLLLAAAQQDSQTFLRHSVEIYGKPPRALFHRLISQKRSEWETRLDSSHEEVQKAAEFLLQNTKPAPVNVPAQMPDEKSLEAITSTVESQITLPEGFDEQREVEIDTEQMQDILRQALMDIGATDWKVIPREDGSISMSVDQSKKVIKVPTSRTWTMEKAYALNAHEVGTHVKREVQAGKGPLLIMGGFGLAKYEGPEEGVATMNDQVVENTPLTELPRIDYFLGISWALGLDKKPRDFRQVFNLMRAYYILEAKNTDDIQKVVQNAENVAWERCVRTFRGTSCAEAGVCFTKDIIYLTGRLAVLKWLPENDYNIEFLNQGKFDPTNKEQLKLLSIFGITPQQVR